MGIIQKNGFWTTVISYTGAFIGFISSIFIYPKILTTEQVGLTQILKVVAMLLAQFSILGGGQIVLRFFPFFKSGEKQFNGIFTLTFLISFSGILISTILFFLLQPIIIDYYQSQSSLFVKYSLLVIPISIAIVFYTLFSAWLRSLMKIIASAVYLEIVLRLLLIAIVILYATDVISFNAFIILFACSHAVPAVGLFFHCLRCEILTFKFEITAEMKKHAKPAIKYGLFCLFSGLGTSFAINIDSLMLTSMIGLASVGIYNTTAINFTSMLYMPYRAFSSISSPVVAEYWQKNDMKGMQTLYQRFSLNIIIISLLFFLMIWLNLDAVYLNMPADYATGRWAFFILFIGRFVDIATGLNSVILSTSKKYVWDLYFSILLIIIAVISNQLLIPPFGINGAALATTLCIILLSVLKVWIVKRFFKIQPFTGKIWIVILIGIATGLIISFIPVFLHWILDVVMRCGLICLLFLLPVYLLKISNEVNTTANKILGTAFHRNPKNKS